MKDQARRLRDTGDAEDALRDGPAATAVPAHEAPAPPSSRTISRWAPWGIAAALASGLAYALLAPRALSPLPMTLQVHLGADSPMGTPPYVALSPDGQVLVFGDGSETTASPLFVRRLDQQEATPLKGI